MNNFQFTLALAAIVAVGSVFIDTEAHVARRGQVSLNGAQIEADIAFLRHMASPLPGQE
jgi:hypothetical protein